MPGHQALTLRSCDFKLLAAGGQERSHQGRKGHKVYLKMQDLPETSGEVILVLICPNSTRGEPLPFLGPQFLRLGNGHSKLLLLIPGKESGCELPSWPEQLGVEASTQNACPGDFQNMEQVNPTLFGSTETPQKCVD